MKEEFADATWKTTSNHGKYLLDGPIHNFPEVICEDDVKPMIQVFGNHCNNIFLQPEDVSHSFDFKCGRPTFNHFPEVICEDDTRPEPTINNFVYEQRSYVKHSENIKHYPTLDFKVNPDNFNKFPEVICEDDAEPRPILKENLCPLSKLIDNSKNVSSGTSLLDNILKPNRMVTCKDELCGPNLLDLRTEGASSENPNHSYEDFIMEHEEEENDFCHDDLDDRLQDSILTSLTELEEAVFTKETHKLSMPCMYINDAADLLSAHADLLKMDDPWKQLQQAVSSGRTIRLTEAGQQALSMIKPDPIILPFQHSNDEVSEEKKDKFIKNRNSNNSTSATESNLASPIGANTCNAVMLRTEHTGRPIVFLGGNETSIDASKQNKNSECSNKKVDCDSEFLELDNSLQMLSNLYDSRQWNTILREQLSNENFNENLLQSEISNIYKKMKTDENDQSTRGSDKQTKL